MSKTIMLCTGLCLAGPAVADGGATPVAELVPVSSFVADTGDVIRIESAEYLRTYSQEVAAAACYLFNGIDTSLSRALLVEARDGFDTRLNALRDGDEALGIIGREERRKTLVKSDAVETVWLGMTDAVDALVASPSDADAIGVIKARNMELFDLTDLLVTTVYAQYSNPSILVQADALMLEIVGRQAMMTQKIAKDACQIFTGIDAPELKENLAVSKQIYEVSLRALLDGMPELGLLPAPTPEIKASLEAIQADWQGVRPILDALVSGESVTRDQQVYLFKHKVEEMVRLEDVSHACVDHANYDY